MSDRNDNSNDPKTVHLDILMDMIKNEIPIHNWSINEDIAKKVAEYLKDVKIKRLTMHCTFAAGSSDILLRSLAQNQTQLETIDIQPSDRSTDSYDNTTGFLTQILKSNLALRQLRLDTTVITWKSNDGNSFCQQLQSHQRLSQLGIGFYETDLKTFWNAVSNSKSITEAFVSGVECELHLPSISNLLLKRKKDLQTLILNDFRRYEGCSKITSALASAEGLKTFHITGEDIGYYGNHLMDMLSRGIMANKSITELRLRDIEFDKFRWQDFGTVLAKNQSVQTLDLIGCAWDMVSLVPFLGGLSIHKNLKEFAFGCGPIAHREGPYFEVFLNKEQLLQSLKLNAFTVIEGRQLSEDIFRPIARRGGIPNIEFTGPWRNDLIAIAMPALTNCKNTTSFSMTSEYDLDLPTAKIISSMLRTNTTLIKLTIKETSMNDQCAEEIAKGLAMNKTLQYISFIGNNLTNVGKKALRSAAKTAKIILETYNEYYGVHSGEEYYKLAKQYADKSTKKYQEAIECCDKALRLLPPSHHDYADCWLVKGRALFALNDYDNAILATEAVFANESFNLQALIQLSEMHTASNNWVACYWALQYAQVVDPTDLQRAKLIADIKKKIDSKEDNVSWKDCSVCSMPHWAEHKNKKCGLCKQVYYCNSNEQKRHWPIHRHWCAINKK